MPTLPASPYSPALAYLVHMERWGMNASRQLQGDALVEAQETAERARQFIAALLPLTQAA